jgi:hypothetical protein
VVYAVKKISRRLMTQNKGARLRLLELEIVRV